MSQTNQASYDARVYTVCAPWLGERGDKHLNVFKPQFLNGLEGITDTEGWSLREHALGTDTGGNAGGAPAFPGGGGALALAARGSYRARSSKLKSLIYKHVENPAIKTAIDSAVAALPAAVAARAAAVAAGAAVVPPLPYNAPDGVSAGQLAMAVADHFGLQPVSGLSETSRDQMWHGMTARPVGRSPETMIQLKDMVDKINNERPVGVRFDDDRCRLKFLSLIDSPPSLISKAVEEMQRCSYLNAAGAPDYLGTVNAFDELWRLYFSRGDVRPQAPQPIRTAANSGRVDGMQVHLEGDDESAYELDLSQDGEPLLFAVTTGGARVKICWKCSGVGHTKRDCPSRGRTSPRDAIQLLQQLDEDDQPTCQTTILCPLACTTMKVTKVWCVIGLTLRSPLL